MTKNPIDAHVGSRVRLRRMLVGMSQEKLGAHLSLTFQQVQKYEKGDNRIGSSRLYVIATVLNVPVQFFFDDMPESIAAASLAAEGEPEGERGIMGFVASSEGLQLNTAFSQIPDAETRRRIVELVKTLASAQAKEAA